MRINYNIIYSYSFFVKNVSIISRNFPELRTRQFLGGNDIFLVLYHALRFLIKKYNKFVLLSRKYLLN